MYKIFKYLIFELSACAPNRYGYGCKKTCGSCLHINKELCNKVTGACTNGCNNNRQFYIPPLCQTSNNLLYDI